MTATISNKLTPPNFLSLLFGRILLSRCDARATVWWNSVCLQCCRVPRQPPALHQLQLRLDRPPARHRLRQLPVSHVRVCVCVCVCVCAKKNDQERISWMRISTAATCLTQTWNNNIRFKCCGAAYRPSKPEWGLSADIMLGEFSVREDVGRPSSENKKHARLERG